MHISSSIKTAALMTAACLLAPLSVARAADSDAIKAKFADPPRQYSSAPLWVWNDMLTEEQIRSTLRDLAGQKVKQAFVHPRPGLMTPYLSADWFRLWKAALDEAERLDMNIWIYDENSYPSGFAGGLVPEALPESRGLGLDLRETARPDGLGKNVMAVFQWTGDGYKNVTREARRGAALPEGRYLSALLREAPAGGWFGGKWYVDLLMPGVTEKFIEITMEAYRREIGDQFGRRVPGWFTDEPHLAPAGGLHWSKHLPQLFRERWGYDLVEHLPALVRPVGDWRRVRHNYRQLLLEQFIDRWAKPCYEYCERHNLEFTGHYWEHGWPDAGHGGDNMAMYAWHQRPAIDTLMNQYREDAHAQFGNARALKELSSVANQLGRNRTLCEAYGAGGWDLRFEDMKRIGDWLYVLGVNTLDEHLSYITIRGARKRDHPQSFSYHEPWWEAYHVMAAYFTRLSLVMSQGQQINRVLLLEPTTTAWIYQPDKRLEEIGESFQKLVTALEAAQAEYDIGCEDIMARHGSVRGGKLVVGRRGYDTVILPPNTENLNAKTIQLLEAYLAAGGDVFCCGPPPALVEGAASPRGPALASHQTFRQVSAESAPQLVLSRSNDGFSIRRAFDDAGILFHHRRRLDDGDILFLVNTSIDETSAGTVQAAGRGVEQWMLTDGSIAAYPFHPGREGVAFDFELPPCGSLLLLISDDARKPASPVKSVATHIAPVGPTVVRRLEPNVLTLDYVDVAAGGETKKGVYCWQASQFVFARHGMEGDPWERAVQFRDELIRKTFPPESGFEATYRFVIAERVPPSLEIVIERPDLCTVSCNGKPVAAGVEAWWLDKSFGRIDIRSAARVGENAVTINASPMTMYHELEPAYVLGEFALASAQSGFVIVPGRDLHIDLKGVGWDGQGCPFYADGVAYRQSFDVGELQGSYHVKLPSWRGSVAEVRVNGQRAGYVTHRPWECYVTPLIRRGENDIEVVVIGTLKNTLGPHHAGAILGTAWPGMFQKAPETGPPPGEQYHTVSYGLFEPFTLQNLR